MASSLFPACTPLKLKYDACFNAWFEGYLEPITHRSREAVSKAELEHRTREMAADYERKCGKVWRSYRECVQVCEIFLIAVLRFSPDVHIQRAVADKGLDQLLKEAREDNPLKTPRLQLKKNEINKIRS